MILTVISEENLFPLFGSVLAIDGVNVVDAIGKGSIHSKIGKEGGVVGNVGGEKCTLVNVCYLVCLWR